MNDASTRPVAVGLDVGGTNLRAAAVAADGTVLAHHTRRNPVGGRTRAPAEAGDTLVAALVDAAAAVATGLPVGVGIASLVERGGRLLGGPNLGVGDLHLGNRLRAAVGQRVTVVNDATAAVWGEYRAGAAIDAEDVLLITVGTGVGGGVVTGGRVLVGATGVGGELGHVVVQARGGRTCPCGGHGHLESYASGRAIGAIAAERVAEGDLTGVLAQLDVVDGYAVTLAARKGDAEAAALLREVGHWLGVGIASLVNVFDPAVVLVGGGAGEAAGDWLLPAAAEALGPELVERDLRRIPPIRLASLGDEAGVVGAALLASDRL